MGAGVEYRSHVTSPEGEAQPPGEAPPLGTDHFDSYFRPRDESPTPQESPAQPVAPVPTEAPAADAAEAEVEVIQEPAPASPPAPDEASVDTGRLFRSQGVEGHGDAVLALTSDHGGKLRTLNRASTAVAADEVVTVTSAEPPRDPQPRTFTKDVSVEDAGAVKADADRGLRAPFVYLIVMGVTVGVAFINAWLSSGKLGWPTGVALLLSSIFAAVTVRRRDDFHAMVVPPLAFALAALTAPQVFVGQVISSILNRADIAFVTLAENWIFIIGSTLAAVVIVVVRRYKP